MRFIHISFIIVIYWTIKCLKDSQIFNLEEGPPKRKGSTYQVCNIPNDKDSNPFCVVQIPRKLAYVVLN